jgi:hypothetical protein
MNKSPAQPRTQHPAAVSAVAPPHTVETFLASASDDVTAALTAATTDAV